MALEAVEVDLALWAAALVALVPARKEEVPRDARRRTPPSTRSTEQWADVSMESRLQHIHIPGLPRKFGSTAPRSAGTPDASLPPPRTRHDPAAGRASATSPITNRRVFAFPQRTVTSPPSPARFKGDVRRTQTPRRRATRPVVGGEETAARVRRHERSALGRRPRPGR